MDNDIIGVELQDKVQKLCGEHLGGIWSEISPSEISISPISGGASNLLYYCSLPANIKVRNGELSQILIRFYGNQSATEDIAIQCEIFDLLSKKSLGPKLYGIFDEGRLEEFLPANSLTCEEIRNEDISRIIAQKLAIVHSLNVAIDKDESWLIERLQEWTWSICNDVETSIGSLEHTNNWQSTKAIACQLLSIDFQKEIKFIKEEVFEKSSSIKVFSHNDLHQGNILFAEPSKRRPTLKERIVFIDFEYCSYNYRAYDIANHLCEWLFQYGTPKYPHFICYKEKFPSRDDQLDFIHHYLSEIFKLQDSQTVIIEKQLQDQKSERKQVAKEADEEDDDEHIDGSGGEEEEDENIDDEILVEKEEEEEYDDDYILCNDRREITGDIQTNENKINNTDNNKSVNGHNNIRMMCHETDNNSNNIRSINNGHNINNKKRTRNYTQCHNSPDKHISINNKINISDEEEQLYREIQPFYMSVSLFWTLWCIKQAQTSTIKFGYWEHAMDRWNLYTHFKSSHINEMNKLESKPSLDNTNH